MPIEELEEKVRRMQATKGSQTTYLDINGVPNASQGQDGDQAIRSTDAGKIKSIKIGSDWYDSILLPSINKVGIASSKIGKLSITADEIDIKGANLLDFVSAESIANPGYLIFKSGLIIQWGQKTYTTNSTTDTYPIAFPNNCLFVVGNGASSSHGPNHTVMIDGSNPLTVISLYKSVTNSRTTSWLAIGN